MGAGTPPDLVHEDGVWKLIPQGEGKYRIVNVYSNRALYAKTTANWESGWGAGYPAESVTGDGLWTLSPDESGGYRIINVKSHRALYAKAGGAGEMSWSGGVGAGSPPLQVKKDAHWRLEFVS